MKRVVIDASVALKWFLSDEEHGEKALDILEAHASDRISLHAPALLEFEVANGLVIAKRRTRAGMDDIMKAMEGFTELGIELYPLSHLFQGVLEYSDRYDISAHDAAYVALAAELKSRAVTAGKRLFNASRKLRLVKWIGDFRA